VARRTGWGNGVDSWLGLLWIGLEYLGLRTEEGRRPEVGREMIEAAASFLIFCDFIGFDWLGLGRISKHWVRFSGEGSGQIGLDSVGMALIEQGWGKGESPRSWPVPERFPLLRGMGIAAIGAGRPRPVVVCQPGVSWSTVSSSRRRVVS